MQKMKSDSLSYQPPRAQQWLVVPSLSESERINAHTLSTWKLSVIFNIPNDDTLFPRIFGIIYKDLILMKRYALYEVCRAVFPALQSGMFQLELVDIIMVQLFGFSTKCLDTPSMESYKSLSMMVGPVRMAMMAIGPALKPKKDEYFTFLSGAKTTVSLPCFSCEMSIPIDWFRFANNAFMHDLKDFLCENLFGDYEQARKKWERFKQFLPITDTDKQKKCTLS